MARALIVGCGCRGRALGQSLAAEGWAVRGTTRAPDRLAGIQGGGIEAVVADPDHPGTLLEQAGDVTVVYWLLGSAQAEPEVIAALYGPRLERLLEKLVDTPVRAFVYEAAGGVPSQHLQRGAQLVRSASETWRIPVEVVDADPTEPEKWLGSMLAATRRLIGQPK